jgi:hypothetical protein
VVFHRAFDLPGAPGRPGMSDLPGGAEWLTAIEAIPPRERHLHTHRGHLTYPNDIDRKVLTGDVIRRFTFTGEAPELRERMRELGARGVTEIAYQPAGPDIPRELTTFARMAASTLYLVLTNLTSPDRSALAAAVAQPELHSRSAAALNVRLPALASWLRPRPNGHVRPPPPPRPLACTGLALCGGMRAVANTRWRRTSCRAR